MKTSGWNSFWIGALLLSCLVTANAQRMPQDSWHFSQVWGGSRGTGDGQFSYPFAVAVSPTGRVFVADTDNCRIQVFESDGTFVRKWGSLGSLDGQFRGPYGIAVSPDGRVFVADIDNCRIQVFESDGTFVRKWGSPGSADGQFGSSLSPFGVAVSPTGRVLVTDLGNSRIQVFESDGTFVRKWGSLGSLDGQFSGPYGIAVSSDGRVFVSESSNGRIQVFGSEGTFIRKLGVGRFGDVRGMAVFAGLLFVADQGQSQIYVFELDGTFVRSWVGSGSADGLFRQPQDVAVSPDGRVYIVDTWNHRVQVYGLAGYRITPQLGNLPLPSVINCAQRAGTPYLDVDYVISDVDSPTVNVEMAAFEGGQNSLSNFVKISTFVDGTEANCGTNILVNVTNRISWNVAADWEADYVNLKVRVMAQDERGLLSVDFVTLPAEGTNTALRISRSPITQSDMLPLWFWLLADGDPSVTLNQGRVYGAGGGFDGVLLAQNTTTTADGRAFLFQKMGVRAATVIETDRAKIGPSGVVNQWTPRFTVGPGDRPKAVNEYGFDTGNWGSDGWWVVKE